MSSLTSRACVETTSNESFYEFLLHCTVRVRVTISFRVGGPVDP